MDLMKITLKYETPYDKLLLKVASELLDEDAKERMGKENKQEAKDSKLYFQDRFMGAYKDAPEGATYNIPNHQVLIAVIVSVKVLIAETVSRMM